MKIARLATISSLHDELDGAWRDFFSLASPGHLLQVFSVRFSLVLCLLLRYLLDAFIFSSFHAPSWIQPGLTPTHHLCIYINVISLPRGISRQEFDP